MRGATAVISITLFCIFTRCCCSKVYVALFKKSGWAHSKVSMLTDDSSGEFPVYHRLMADEFKKEGITLASQDLLARKKYLKPSDYGKVDYRSL